MIKTESIKVLIVDDHQVVREGLRSVLEMEKGMTVVGEACSGEEAIEQAVLLGPDVIIMDLKMSGMDGIAAAREIKQRIPDTAILMLTLYAENYVKQAIEAGVSGYLLKDSDCDQIITAIDQVHNGLSPLAPSLTKELVTEFVRLSRNGPTTLSKRQVEVLKLIANGVSSSEIGDYLYISPSTVKREIRTIFDKLGVNDRAHAVSEGFKRNLI